jgi:hypothetical protein
VDLSPQASGHAGLHERVEGLEGLSTGHVVRELGGLGGGKKEGRVACRSYFVVVLTWG